MSELTPRIVERDGRVVRIIAGDVEVLAEMELAGKELILSRLSIDGVGAGSLGLKGLRALGRTFAQSMGATRLRVRGTNRTTGANPGKIPRDVIIEV